MREGWSRLENQRQGDRPHRRRLHQTQLPDQSVHRFTCFPFEPSFHPGLALAVRQRATELPVNHATGT
jgi:hypothetical protein